MKKVFKTLVVLFVMFCTVPAFACSQKTTGSITGGACSIKELNNLENSKIVKGKTNQFLYGTERNLRPVKPNFEKINTGSDCIFGMCLYRNLLEEATTNK